MIPPDLIGTITDLGGWGALAIIAWQLVQAVRELAAANSRYQAEVARAIRTLADEAAETRRAVDALSIGARYTTERRRVRR